jgi:hypothetical protein
VKPKLKNVLPICCTIGMLEGRRGVATFVMFVSSNISGILGVITRSSAMCYSMKETKITMQD